MKVHRQIFDTMLELMAIQATIFRLIRHIVECPECLVKYHSILDHFFEVTDKEVQKNND